MIPFDYNAGDSVLAVYAPETKDSETANMKRGLVNLLRFYDSNTLLEVVIYYLGTISTWTGLTVLKMNPFRIFPKSTSTLKTSLDKSFQVKTHVNTGKFRQRMTRYEQVQPLALHRFSVIVYNVHD